ncbi:mesoderm-specific transcript homolog protein-like isoform X2 [Watersipora subatra]
MSFDWIKMWPALTKNFNRVIAVDFLGYGMSDKPIGHHYSLIEQANLVTDLLKMLQVDSFHILSHDYGDSVAQELLARHNNGETAYEIRSACLLNGGMFKETNFPRPIQNLLTASPLAGDILSLLSNRYIFGRGLSDVFGPNSQPSEEDLYDFWCGACHKEGYKSMAALLGYIGERSLHNTRWRKALQDSIAPIHVIYGPADPVNPSGFIDFYKREIVNGSIDVLVEGVGHYPQWEDSETVTKLYLQFVASNL